MSTYRWFGNKLVDIEENPKMHERWIAEGKMFSVGDRVRILDGSDVKNIVGYEWDEKMAPLIGKTRKVERRIVNYYGYLVGYRLKSTAGIFNPDFLERAV